MEAVARERPVRRGLVEHPEAAALEEHPDRRVYALMWPSASRTESRGIRRWSPSGTSVQPRAVADVRVIETLRALESGMPRNPAPVPRFLVAVDLSRRVRTGTRPRSSSTGDSAISGARGMRPPCSKAFRWNDRVKILTEREDRPVLLFRSRWELEHAERKHPELRLSAALDGDSA